MHINYAHPVIVKQGEVVSLPSAGVVLKVHTEWRDSGHSRVL